MMATPGNRDSSRSFSQDLERGPDVLSNRSESRAGIPDDLGSIIDSEDSSIMGDADQPDLGDEWGPQHPCYPHLNIHVATDSAEYTTTRIIRIRRDWLVQGDLAPTFSNLYPEILDPAGISETEFRRVVEKLNSELVPIFNPYNWRNILDGVLGLVTGWIWDDLGLTNTKSRLRSLEDWIEKWNSEMEKTIGAEDGSLAPKIVPLRRTGYMNLDIQIPDPEIAPAVSERTNTREGPDHLAEPELAVLAESTDDGVYAIQ
ncbi:Golgin subfamily A member 7/ERF4 family [Microdochium nivale]|nr:Golgin subfamily A member 7/ERF4 family [Microdochium nivale]